MNKIVVDGEVTAMDHDHTGQLIFCGDGQVACFVPILLSLQFLVLSALRLTIFSFIIYRDLFTQLVWTPIQVCYLELIGIEVAASIDLLLQLFSTGHFLCLHEALSCWLLLVMEVCLFSGQTEIFLSLVLVSLSSEFFFSSHIEVYYGLAESLWRWKAIWHLGAHWNWLHGYTAFVLLSVLYFPLKREST